MMVPALPTGHDLYVCASRLSADLPRRPWLTPAPIVLSCRGIVPLPLRFAHSSPLIGISLTPAEMSGTGRLRIFTHKSLYIVRRQFLSLFSAVHL